MPLIESKGCECKECLSLAIKAKISTYFDNLTLAKIKEVQSFGTPNKLLEEIDYTINKEGNFVLSAWYLLRQGKCCKNNCQNCPYTKKTIQ
jgi:hypothetical protein